MDGLNDKFKLPTIRKVLRDLSMYLLTLVCLILGTVFNIGWQVLMGHIPSITNFGLGYLLTGLTIFASLILYVLVATAIRLTEQTKQIREHQREEI